MKNSETGRHAPATRHANAIDATRTHPDKNLIALGIRQPWVELILRGIKTIEVRSQATQRRGEIYLYASRQRSTLPAARNYLREFENAEISLPSGLLVGIAEIVACRPCEPTDAASACVPSELLKNQYAWELSNVRRLATPMPVDYLPYGVWFYPFRRKGTTRG